MSTQDLNRLQNHVNSIAETISKGFDETELNQDDEPMSAYDYLQDALDIEYIVNGKGEYLGARVLVAFGGPNIWVNTRSGIVEGYWWGDSANASFNDEIGLDDALSELWACR
jgi:hypothetical protein